MARKRKLTNPLALAVLATLHSGPMHPYQIARLLRHRGKDDVIKIRYGSLYTVVQDLEQRGFVAAEGTERAGHRPERTVYRLTEDGAEELAERLRELISEPVKEYPVFAAALSLIAALHPDELAGLLAERLQAVELDIVGASAVLEHAASHRLPRLFMLEAEYVLAMKRAEADWVRELLRELQDGTFADLKLWRGVHENGEFPPELQDTDWARADRAVLNIGEGRPQEGRPQEGRPQEDRPREAP